MHTSTTLPRDKIKDPAYDMVPEPLAGIYQQYKQDTDSVAQWLASAALANGRYRALRGSVRESTGLIYYHNAGIRLFV